MTIQNLVKELKKLNVDPRYYAYGGELKNNAYNIEKMYNGKFAVYYLERGEKCGLKVFDKETDANLELLNSLKFDLEHGLDLTK